MKSLPVELGPGPQVLQPGHDLHRRPVGHGFTDEQVVLLWCPTAPVKHHHRHLDTRREKVSIN